MTARRRASIVVALLISVAFVFSLSWVGPPIPRVYAAITLTPDAGGGGTVVQVTGGGFGVTDTTCSITATGPSSSLISSSSCTMSSGTGTISLASFTVSSSAVPGLYTVRVTGSPVGDTQTASFTVPSIVATPPDGPAGTTITITGSGFSSGALTCTISSSTAGLVTSPGACTLNGASPSAIVAASFVIGSSVAAGTYTVSVTDNNGASAPISIIVRTAPKISLNPALGPPSQVVTVSQSSGQWSSTDNTCTITSPTVGLITSSSCIMVSGVLQSTSQFQVSAVAAVGPNEIDVTGGTTLVIASATFTVTSTTPTIVVVPTDGPLGTKISVQGTGFSASDSSCQITSAMANLVASQSCSVSGGKVTGSFTVGVSVVVNTPTTITVTGNTGDSATVAFTNDGAPVITLSSGTGAPGDTITITLTGGQFSSGDSSACVISSAPGGLFASSACVISAGGTALTGTFFVVANLASGNTYTVTVTGSLGDKASASFTVVVPLSLTLTPSFDHPGQTISFVGRGYSTLDSSCTLTSTADPNGATLIGSSTCSISGGTATGTFVTSLLATVAGNTYTVTLTGNPNGDSFGTSFTVVPNITLSPTNGSPGTSVSVSGYGFSSAGTTCTLSASPPGVLFAAAPVPSCAFMVPGPGGSGQIAGTFTVDALGPAPAGNYVVTATDNLLFAASATFQVGTPSAQVTLNPNVATFGQSVGVSGSGFNGGDSACVINDPSGALIAPGSICSVAGGTVGGSFTVCTTATCGAPAPPGTYWVYVSATPAGDFAGNYIAIMTVTTQTSTIVSTSVTTTATTTSTTSTTTGVSQSLSTTTLQTTGFSTWIFTSKTATTTFGQTTTSVASITTSTSISTFLTSITTTTTTTITHSFGQIIQQSSRSEIYPDALGILAMLSLAIPFFLRRFTS